MFTSWGAKQKTYLLINEIETKASNMIKLATMFS